MIDYARVKREWRRATSNVQKIMPNGHCGEKQSGATIADVKENI